MLMQGLNLTIVGMLIVFTFLILLVFILMIISKVVQKTERKLPQQTSSGQIEYSTKQEEEAKIAAVLAAITQYRTIRERG